MGMTKLTHEQIMALRMIRLEDGESTGAIIATTNTEELNVVFTVDSVHKSYYNLLRASAFMYQTLNAQKECLQSLVDFLEAQGIDSLVATLLTLQSTLEIAQQTAVSGVEEMVKRTGV